MSSSGNRTSVSNRKKKDSPTNIKDNKSVSTSSSSKRFDLKIEIDDDDDDNQSRSSSTLVCSPKSAQELHKKLSSPERRKMSSVEAEKKYREKLSAATKNLEKIKKDTKKRVTEKAEHMRSVSERKAQMERDKKTRVERKLRRAVENRDKHINKIVSKAVRFSLSLSFYTHLHLHTHSHTPGTRELQGRRCQSRDELYRIHHGEGSHSITQDT